MRTNVIILSASKGGIDHMSIDYDANTLYICGFDASKVCVLNLSSGAVTAVIEESLENPQGVSCPDVFYVCMRVYVCALVSISVFLYTYI